MYYYRVCEKSPLFRTETPMGYNRGADVMAKFIGTYEIPTYAICAIEYWDFSGLDDDDDEKNIKEFISSNFPNGFICDWKGIDDPHFSYFPIFGKGCDVVECDFYLPN